MFEKDFTRPLYSAPTEGAAFFLLRMLCNHIRRRVRRPETPFRQSSQGPFTWLKSPSTIGLEPFGLLVSSAAS